MNWIRSVGAVLAGLVFIVVSHTAMDMLMHSTGVFPPFGEPMTDNGQYALAFTYRAVLSVAGCYLTARLALRHPMAHALALGFVGVVLSTIGMFVMWGVGPVWYPIALVLVSLPAAWLGGTLFLRRRSEASAVLRR